MEGSTTASTVISYANTQNRHKDARRRGRQEQSASEVKKNPTVMPEMLQSEYEPVTYHRSPSVRHRGIVSNVRVLTLIIISVLLRP